MNIQQKQPAPVADVGIVIAVFNGARTLERCLDSIAAQTLRPRQVVVMDGGSTDGTQTILERRGDVVTYWRSEADHGIYDAWNKALAHVDSEWVSFLGADDYFWHEEVLARCCAAVDKASPSVLFAYAKVAMLDEEDSIIECHGSEWVELKNRMRYEMALPHPGAFHRRTLFTLFGYFDSSFRIAADYALVRRALRDSSPLFIDLIAVGAQEGGVSTRPDYQVRSVLEAGRAIRGCGDRLPLGWYWLWVKNQGKAALLRIFGPWMLEFSRNAYRIISGREVRGRPRLGDR